MMSIYLKGSEIFSCLNMGYWWQASGVTKRCIIFPAAMVVKHKLMKEVELTRLLLINTNPCNRKSSRSSEFFLT